MKQFDLKLAKTPSNPNGLDVCNKRGDDIKITKVIEDEHCLYPIIGESMTLDSMCYQKDGKWDLSGTSKLDLYLK